jgi:hypothetical protein
MVRAERRALGMAMKIVVVLTVLDSVINLTDIQVQKDLS